MAIGGVVINFAAKTRDAVADVDRLARSVSDVGTAADKAGGMTKKMGGALKAGLAAGAAAAAAGVVVLANAMWDAGKAAVADQQAADKLARTLRTIPGITEEAIAANADWIDSMELATLIADDDLRAAVGKLALATGDLGEAQRLAAAAADLATESGKSYTSVTDAMAKAAMGNETALKRIAPWLDVNRDGTISLSEALGELEGRFKDSAEAAADNDPWKRMGVIWGQLSEELGGWLLPLVEELGDWFADPKNLKSINQIKDSLGRLSKEVGEKLVPALRDFLKWVTSEQGKKDLQRWAGYIESTASAVASLVSWMDKLSKLNPLALIDSINSKLNNLNAPSWLKGVLGGAAASGRSAPTPSAASRAATTNVTINLAGAFNDPMGNARLIKRVLEGEDVRQGRDRGAPLAVAW